MILFGIAATGFSPGPNNILTSYSAYNFGFKKAIPTIVRSSILGWTLIKHIYCILRINCQFLQRFENLFRHYN